LIANSGICRVSSGGLDTATISDQNKRNKHESSKYSYASFDTHANLLEGLQVKGPLIMQNKCVVASASSCYRFAEQVPSAEELVAAEVVTGFWSIDNDNTVDDQYSGSDSITFSSSEESCSQSLLCRHPFFEADCSISASGQVQKQRDNSWTGESDLLQLQLGSFIYKEKLKLESKFEEGSSAMSKYSLSGSISGVESEELMTGIPDERLSSSCSLSGFLGASSFVEESSEYSRYRAEMLHSSRTSSVLLSCLGNKKTNWFDLSINDDEVAEQADTTMHMETEGQFFLTESIQGILRLPFTSARLEDMYRICSSEVHQKFILSSGRLGHGKGMFE